MKQSSSMNTDTLDPLTLYKGTVMHARMKPKPHRFNYSVFSILIDIDRLEEAAGSTSLFSVNRRNLVSFHECDHGDRSERPLRPQIDKLLNDGGIEKPARILLWCNPRIFGYTFNPLSIYYCYAADNELVALVYQVHNTFGQSHSYVARVANSAGRNGTIRQSADKRFYVSPFLDMDLRYDFRIHPPDETLKIRILEHDNDGPILAATFSGRKKTLNSRNLLLGICKTLGLTWKIMAGIHFEALVLWLKGIRIRPRPSPPGEATFVQQKTDMVAGE